MSDADRHIENAKSIIAEESERSFVNDTLEVLTAEIEQLKANIKRLTNNPADHRYWEGRWRDERAENERLQSDLREMIEYASSSYLDCDDTARIREIEGCLPSPRPSSKTRLPRADQT